MTISDWLRSRFASTFLKNKILYDTKNGPFVLLFAFHVKGITQAFSIEKNPDSYFCVTKKKMQRMLDFIVWRVNKLIISVGPCHSIVLNFWLVYVCLKLLFNRVPWICVCLLSSNQIFFRLSKWIRFKLRCN